MSRDGGFDRADVDTGYLDDPKVRALVRATRDEGTLARAILAHEATLLGSWAAGERIALDEAAPLWLTDLEDLGARLVAVGLLDEGRRIPQHAWQSWFTAAAARREALREKWRAANLRRYRRGNRHGDSAVTTLPPRGDNSGTASGSAATGPSGPDRTSPSVPSVPPIRQLPRAVNDGREIGVDRVLD